MQEMVYFYPNGHQAHAVPGHPERPERVEAIRQALESHGLWSAPLAPLDVPADVLHAVHDQTYLERLQGLCAEGAWYDGDTYLQPASWTLALQSAGGAMRVAQAVWRGEAQYGFALCRPPGHHATPRRAMGFCLLNNVALAAEYLLQCEGAQQLAIVDLDVHHGNGTQDIFWQRSDVLYVSMHQVPLYPGTGSLYERGQGTGAGYTLNCPLPPGTGNAGALAWMQTVILPVLERYAPQMVLVSLGFDAHWRDPLAQLRFSAQGYSALVSALAGFAAEKCAGRMALVLEGGYDLHAGAVGATGVVSALVGAPWSDSLGDAPGRDAREWEPVLREARSIWRV